MASFYLIGGFDFDLKSNYIAKMLLGLTKKEMPSILVFPTAMMDDEKGVASFLYQFQNLKYKYEVVKLYDLPDEKEVLKKAKSSDILFFTGGNTIRTLEFINKYYYDLFIQFSKLDVIISGISAGANIWTKEALADAYSYKDNDNYYNYKMVAGLNIIPISLCPHFNENDRILYFRNFIKTDLAYALENNTALYIDNKKITHFSINGYHIYRFRKENYYIMEYLKKNQIASLGPKGTFSEVAALKYMENNNLDYDVVLCQSIQKAGEKIQELKLGILPFENTIDGYVQETLDILNKYEYNIIDEITIPIDFVFVSKAPNINKVTKVFAQFKAKGQCLNFINEHNFDIIETESNMISYEKVKNSGETYGAIIPAHIDSSRFSLVINNICDKKNNFTRFLVVSGNDSQDYSRKNLKCSLILNAVEDHPGILMEALTIFKKANINLQAIMSRPTKEGLGKYYFYVEFTLLDDKKILDDIIKEINDMNKFKVKLLGYYN